MESPPKRETVQLRCTDCPARMAHCHTGQGVESSLNDDDTRIRRHTRDVCERQLRPFVAELWNTASFDNKIIDACKEIGSAGLQIKGYGCAGLTNLQATLCVLEMARIDASLATFAVVHSGLAMKSIEVAGTEEQKAYWLPKMARWEKIGSFGLTEAEHGSDAGGLKTSAKKVEGGWLLNGTKRWIGNATFSDVTIIWAREEETGSIEGFIVEKHFAGFKTKAIERKASLRIVQNADIWLSNCFVPSSHKMKPGGFAGNTKQVLESSRSLVAAASAGVLLGAYDNAVEYCSSRQQFGRPLTRFQLVQERLMHSLGLCQACCLLAIDLARRLDQGSASMALVALVKATTTQLAREGVRLCREVMGGNGIILDYGVSKALADIEALYTYEGTYDINMLIAGRAATGQNALLP